MINTFSMRKSLSSGFRPSVMSLPGRIGDPRDKRRGRRAVRSGCGECGHPHLSLDSEGHTALHAGHRFRRAPLCIRHHPPRSQWHPLPHPRGDPHHLDPVIYDLDDAISMSLYLLS
jgi:hypothetical protein